MSTKQELKIPLYSEALIRERLPKMFPKVDFSTSKSDGLLLPERELYFRLGQQAVVDLLIAMLDKQIKTQGDNNV